MSKILWFGLTSLLPVLVLAGPLDTVGKKAEEIRVFRTRDSLGASLPTYSFAQSLSKENSQSALLEIWNKNFHIKKMGAFKGAYLFIEITAKQKDELLKVLFQRDVKSLRYRLVKVERVRNAKMFECVKPKANSDYAQGFKAMMTLFRQKKLEQDLEQSSLLNSPSCRPPNIDSDMRKSIHAAFSSVVGSTDSDFFLGCLDSRLADRNTQTKAQIILEKLRKRDAKNSVECSVDPDDEEGSFDPLTGVITLKVPTTKKTIFHETLHAAFWPERVSNEEVSRISSCCDDPGEPASCAMGSVLNANFERVLATLKAQPGLVKALRKAAGGIPLTESLYNLADINQKRIKNWADQNTSMANCDEAPVQNRKTCWEALNLSYWKQQEEILGEICTSLNLTFPGCNILSKEDRLVLTPEADQERKHVGVEDVSREKHRVAVADIVAQLPPPTHTQVPVALPVIVSRGPASGNLDISGAMVLDPGDPFFRQINEDAQSSFALAKQVFSDSMISTASAATLPPLTPARHAGPTASTTYFPASLPIGTIPVATAVSLPAPRGRAAKNFESSVGNNSDKSGGGFVGATSVGSGFQIAQPSATGTADLKLDASLGTSNASGEKGSGVEAKGGARGTASTKPGAAASSAGASAVAVDDGLGVSGAAPSGGGGVGDIGGGDSGSGRPSIAKTTGQRLKATAALPQAVARYLKRFGKKLVSEFKSKKPDPELVKLLKDTKTQIQFGNAVYGRNSDSAKEVFILNSDDTLIQTKMNGAAIGTEVGP